MVDIVAYKDILWYKPIGDEDGSYPQDIPCYDNVFVCANEQACMTAVLPMHDMNPSISAGIHSLGSNIVSVSCSRHILAFVNAEGQLVLGRNFRVNAATEFELWEFITDPRNTFLSSIVQVVEVSAGDQHVLFRSKDGLAFACGTGLSGELGVGDAVTFAINPVLIPRPRDGSTHISCIAAGFQTSALITAPCGRLYTFGSGAYYRLGHGNTENCYAPSFVEALEFCGYTCPQTGICSGISMVSCGTWHMAAVAKYTTDVYSWGWNKFHQVSPRIGSLEPQVQLFKTPHRMAALDQEEYLGDKNLARITGSGISTGTESLREYISKISCGARHTAILLKNGRKLILIGKRPEEPMGQVDLPAESSHQNAFRVKARAPPKYSSDDQCNITSDSIDDTLGTVATVTISNVIHGWPTLNSQTDCGNESRNCPKLSEDISCCCRSCQEYLHFGSLNSNHWGISATIICGCSQAPKVHHRNECSDNTKGV